MALLNPFFQVSYLRDNLDTRDSLAARASIPSFSGRLSSFAHSGRLIGWNRRLNPFLFRSPIFLITKFYQYKGLTSQSLCLVRQICGSAWSISARAVAEQNG